jgi:nitrate/nitrite transporter NarK
MFSSGFGQTYYIALFAGYMSSELALSSGQFGSLYTAATLAGASLLMSAGRLADRFPIRWLGSGVLAALALTAFGVAGATSVWTLGLALFGLRFFGQGMLPHVAMTAVARWFVRKRGRAIAVAALGLPAAEAAMPIAAVAAIGIIGWRATWVAAACALALVAVPAFVILLQRERKPAGTGSALSADSPVGAVMRQWTRAEVLRSPMFYALMPVVLAHPFVITGVFFNQVAIVEMKGWQLTWWAASFPALAAAHVLSALGAGWLVDRIGSRRLLPLVLVPLQATDLLNSRAMQQSFFNMT